MELTEGPGADGVLARPRLERRIDDVLDRRLTVLVAGAGYGKSTLVGAWSRDVPSAWVHLSGRSRDLRVLAASLVRALDAVVPGLGADLEVLTDSSAAEGPADPGDQADGFAALFGEALERRLERDTLLVVDDLHEISGASGPITFVERLVREATDRLHVVLTSRQEVPFPIARLRGQGQVLDLSAEQLAFTPAETASLLGGAEASGGHGAVTAEEVHALTGGWPALTRLVIESLREAPAGDQAAALARIRAPGGPLFAYVVEEVLDREPADVLDVLRVAVRLPRVTPELLDAIGMDGASAILDQLVRRALLVERRLDGRDAVYGFHTLLEAYADRRLPIDPGELREIHRRAARWHEAEGRPADALASLVAAGDVDAVAALLRRDGLDLVARGGFEVVLRAIATLPSSARDARIELVAGDAMLSSGDWAGAFASLRRAGGDADRLPSAVAWRIGLIQHELGETPVALATYLRGDIGAGGDPVDDALLASWTAVAYWTLVRPDDARPWAVLAREIAERSGSDRAMAAAMSAVGAVAHLDGDPSRCVEAYRAGVAAAERAGDGVLLVRIRTDLAYNLHLEGRYGEALAELDLAVRLADALSHPTFVALAKTERSFAHIGLDQYEEALADARAGRADFDRIGSRWAAYAMLSEGTVHQLRGDTVQARAAFEAALPDSEHLVDSHTRAYVIAHLAEIVAEDEPERGAALVEEAMSISRASQLAVIPLVAARVAMAAGDRALASERVAATLDVAQRRRDRPSLASAMELNAELAALDGDRAAAARSLERAGAVRAELGSAYGQATHDLVRARVLGGDAGRASALAAAAAFRSIGARSMAGEAEDVATRIAAAGTTGIDIRALGTFRVLRGGEPVPTGEWQSKRARSLLKVLIARRGHAVTREELCEVLWPDEDPGPLLNRLSVALTIVRTILDPDRRFPQDHYLRSEGNAVSLDAARLALDTERFLELEARADRLLASGDREAAVPTLREAEAAYGGDLLEEDPDAEWAAGLREEARAAYLRVVRALAEEATRTGDTDGALRRYLRILDQDPFDEDAHLGLVRALLRAGRHGEARRRYGIYAARMSELQLEAASFPSPAPAGA